MSEKVTEWAELKQEVVKTAVEAAGELYKQALELAIECGQAPSTRFKLVQGQAKIELAKGEVWVNGDPPERAWCSPWPGEILEWRCVLTLVRRYTYPKIVREELVQRL